MSWEISIGPEVWNTIKQTLNTWSVSELTDALAVADVEEYLEEHPEEYANNPLEKMKDFYDGLPQYMRVQIALYRIEQHNTCNNGGNGFWIDQEGYHTVEIP